MNFKNKTIIFCIIWTVHPLLHVPGMFIVLSIILQFSIPNSFLFKDVVSEISYNKPLFYYKLYSTDQLKVEI